MGWKLRALLGLAVAPLMPGLLSAIFDSFARSSVGFGWYLTFSAGLGYPIAILFGIPLYFLSLRYHLTGLIVYIAMGLVLGAVAYFAVFAPGIVVGDSSAWYATKASIALLPAGAFCGAIATAFFWLIARPDRVPNRQPNSA